MARESICLRIAVAVRASVAIQEQERNCAATPDDVSLVLTGGRTVVWGSAADSAEKARVLRLLLRRHADRYDVSVPDVAVTG